MNARRVSLPAAGLTTVLALAFAAWQFHATRGIQAQRTEAQRQRAALERDVREAATRIESAERGQAELAATLVELQQPVPSRRASAAEMKRAGENFPFSLKEVLAKDPKLQAMHLAAERLIIRRQYDPFCRASGLTPAQAEKLRAVELAYRERLLDIEATMRGQKLADDDPALVALRQAADAEHLAQRGELLGDGVLARLEDYDRTLPGRMLANALATRLALSETPLTMEQSDALTQVIANASQGYRAGGKVDALDEYMEALANPAWRGPIPDHIDWVAVGENARAVLSPSQQAEFEASIAQFNVIRIFNLAHAYVRSGRGDPAPSLPAGR